MLRTCLLFSLLATPALAEAPRVATDIAPVQSLVSLVMEGVGTPDLIVRPGASPHGYAMRPSEARALQEADLVVWMGEGLTPWLEKPLENLAGEASHLELLKVEGTVLLMYRDSHAGVDHEGHDEAEHEHEEHADDEHGHGDHEHDDHGHDEAHHVGDGHDHEGVDPHAWLDPRNAARWLDAVAGELARLDPENAERYRANAQSARAALDAQAEEIAERLEPMRDVPFIAFHDAYQYFETRFGLTLAGTVSLSDAGDPSPAQLADLRERVSEANVACAFTEPQFNPSLIETAIEGGDTRVFTLDPLGTGREPGPALYGQVLADMAESFAACAASIQQR